MNIQKIDYAQSKIQNYEDIYITQDISALSTVKMKIIQEMIQIQRPMGWSMDNVEKIAKEMNNIELYNSKANNNFDKTRKKWNKIT